MGLGEKKEKTRRGNRAGLHFPVHLVKRQLKTYFPKKKFQKNTDVSVTALCEYLLTQILLKSANEVVKGQYITPEHIHKILNESNSNLAGIFPKHVSGLH